MKRVLVTGGAGFIGSHLSSRLLSDGYEVFCIDNFVSGNRKNIEGILTHPNFHFFEFDVIKDINVLKDKITPTDLIFHLASPASPNKNNKKSYINHPIETLLVNSIGSYHLLEYAKEQNAKYLFASSSEIYGQPMVHPQTEKYFGNVNPVGPRSVYDEAKRFGEAIAMAYYRAYNLNSRIIRIFNTYGEHMGDDGRVVANFIQQALANKPLTIYGDGKQTRSFCYVLDLIEAIVKAMFTENTQGEVFNLGNPTEMTIQELAILIKNLTKANGSIVYHPLPQDDPSRRKPDITKAKKILNWEPKVSPEEGLRQTIEYFKSMKG